jgi:DNA-3-methyladenine glycosylase
VGRPLTLTRADLSRPVLEVARGLLGAHLAAGRSTVRLTEVEAYAGEADPGSHAFRGRTPRTQVMFGPAGHAYVYFTYGMHWCMNVVAGVDGEASAVLLRAGEVVEGLDEVVQRRPGVRERDLCRGPARLCKALGISGEHTGTDLLDPRAPVRLLPGAAVDAARVRSGPRVGVAGDGAAAPWRLWIDGEPTVSPYRPAVRRTRRAPS